MAKEDIYLCVQQYTGLTSTTCGSPDKLVVNLWPYRCKVEQLDDIRVTLRPLDGISASPPAEVEQSYMYKFTSCGDAVPRPRTLQISVKIRKQNGKIRRLAKWYPILL